MNNRQLLKSILTGKIRPGEQLRRHLGIVSVLFAISDNINPGVVTLMHGKNQRKVSETQFKRMDKSSFDMIWEEIKTY